MVFERETPCLPLHLRVIRSFRRRLSALERLLAQLLEMAPDLGTNIDVIISKKMNQRLGPSAGGAVGRTGIRLDVILRAHGSLFTFFPARVRELKRRFLYLGGARNKPGLFAGFSRSSCG